jgi:thymidine kinase
MFLEKDLSGKRQRGWIEVICGSMFSGKTEELIRRLNRARIAKQRVEIFKPVTDSRYSVADVVSHNDNAIRSTPVDTASTILLLTGDVDVIGIDEAQFFDNSIIEVCEKLANMGIRVIVAGLDMDFKGAPFGPIPQLMATAEFVTKLHAICMNCGSLAHFSHRLSDEAKLVMLGERDEYEPLCRECYSLLHK